MALNQDQQFQELINRSSNILICFSAKNSFASAGDSVAGALALAKFLRLSNLPMPVETALDGQKSPRGNYNKRYSIVCDGFILPRELSFLENADTIENRLTNLRQFIISLNLKNKKISEFSYDFKDDASADSEPSKLEIYILPEQGAFSEEDVAVSNSEYRFDLIITLGTPDLESLGKIYFDQPEFFFNTPIINIDHNLSNENYGQLNLIYPAQTSVCEILYHLISRIDSNLIDEEIATDLLTGIISKTQSFKAPNVTPATLHVASILISQGADREKIISNLYRTKNLATLKLWGRVLARLQHEPNLKLVWSSLPYTDFIKAGANEEDISGVNEELISNSPQAEIVLLIYEKADGNIGGRLYTTPNYDSRYLLNNLELIGTKNFVIFNLKGKTLKEAEAEVVGEIRRKLLE